MGNNGVDADQAYDENGNIRRMQQWGIKGVGSTQVDGLSYGYMAKSNKLRNVLEDPGINDTDTKLGDFRVSSRSLAVTPNRDVNVTDYLYDINGNLTEDRNKDLIGAGTGSGIVYNHLNLAIQVRVAADAANNVKGMIRYRYDATGNKLEKLVNEPASAPNQQVAKETGTVYLADFVYENNKLQFFGQEEGRVRKVIDPDNQAASWVYDYFVKDHLGNVRMVLTDERKVKVYPPATMEVARAADEEALYRNMQTRASLPAGYPVDHYVTPNERAAKVGGTSGKLGPGILLKVMSGDKFNVTVSSWYRLNGTNGTTSSKPIQDIVEALAAGIAPLSNIKVTQQQLLGGPLTSQVGSFLNSQNNQNANNVKAGLHWILLDEQFKIVSGASGFESVPDESVFQNGTSNTQVYRHVRPNLQVPKNGYLYVYVANETDNVSVYFDNLQVSHVPGPLVEETHYYPFGLTMAGISSKALNGAAENKKKFNGYEENKDFDINWLESFYRTYDPQLGRFHQVDPKPTESQSLYSAMLNNPISIFDLLGDTTYYYSNAGSLLLTTYGKGHTNAMVVDDKNVEKIQAYGSKNQGIIDKYGDKANNSGIEAWAGKMGTTYDLNSFSEFYAANKNNAATSIDGTPLKGVSDFQIDGKSADPSKLKSEVIGNVVLNNGTVSVGKNKPYVFGDATGGDASASGNEPNKVGNIHTHPTDKTTQVSFWTGTTFQQGHYFTLYGGQPSPGDHRQARNSNTGYRSVMVDNKRVVLYNGDASQTITIQRK
jgi:RHS repeat-associated protein